MDKAIIVIAVCQVWQVVMQLIEWWKQREKEEMISEIIESIADSKEEENNDGD